LEPVPPATGLSLWRVGIATFLCNSTRTFSIPLAGAALAASLRPSEPVAAVRSDCEGEA
jgi:hypothetical protein